VKKLVPCSLRDWLEYSQRFFAVAGSVIYPTAMADSDSESVTLFQRSSYRYSRETLLSLNVNLPPCPPLEAWVPIDRPLDQQHHPQRPQQQDGSGQHTGSNGGVAVGSDNNKPRKRGKRGGVRLRLRAMMTTVPLPSVVLANVRSFGRHAGNYTLDELHANVRCLAEYRDACLLCFTETWWCATLSPSLWCWRGSGPPIDSIVTVVLLGRSEEVV
jgi:hypothetical protein